MNPITCCYSLILMIQADRICSNRIFNIFYFVFSSRTQTRCGIWSISVPFIFWDKWLLSYSSSLITMPLDNWRLFPFLLSHSLCLFSTLVNLLLRFTLITTSIFFNDSHIPEIKQCK